VHVDSLSKTPKDKSDGVRYGDPEGHKSREVTRLLQNPRIMNNVQFAVCRAGVKRDRRWQTRLIILYPFKPIFFKPFRFRTGLATLSEGGCPNCG